MEADVSDLFFGACEGTFGGVKRTSNRRESLEPDGKRVSTRRELQMR